MRLCCGVKRQQGEGQAAGQKCGKTSRQIWVRQWTVLFLRLRCQVAIRWSSLFPLPLLFLPIYHHRHFIYILFDDTIIVFELGSLED